jgi:hypothetical protein
MTIFTLVAVLVAACVGCYLWVAIPRLYRQTRLALQAQTVHVSHARSEPGGKLVSLIAGNSDATPRFSALNNVERIMPILLWLLGVPLSVIILLMLVGLL